MKAIFSVDEMRKLYGQFGTAREKNEKAQKAYEEASPDVTCPRDGHTDV